MKKSQPINKDNTASISKQSTYLDSVLNFLRRDDLVIAVTILILALVGYYILFPSRGAFHSDSTDTLMWAQASYDAKSWFNTDFFYACLLPFGGQLIMIPLIGIFGVSMTAHVIGMFLFFLLFSASLYGMLRTMKWSKKWSCTTVSIMVLVLSSSIKLREIFWGHIIYYSLGIFFLFVGLILIFKAMEAAKSEDIRNEKYLLYLLFSFVWVALCATNHLDALTLFIVPVIGAIIAERFFNFEKDMPTKEKNLNFLIIAVLAAALVMGYILGIVLRQGMTAGYENAYSSFSAVDSWPENANKFFGHWATLLGVTIENSDKIMSADGILQLIKIITAIVLLAAPVIMTFLYNKIKDRFSRIILISHWIGFLLIMMGYIFGKLSAANWRLSPIVCTSVIITLMLCKWIYTNTNVSRLLLLIIIPLSILCVLSANNISNMPYDNTGDNKLYAISDYIEEQGLNYGYATFWNANAITVISDSKVKIRSIEIENESYRKYLYQTQGSWYNDQPNQEEYFVLVTETEYQQMIESNNSLIQTAMEEMSYGGYRILVYDHNIF